MHALTLATAESTGRAAAHLRSLLVLTLLLSMVVAGPPPARAETIVVGDGDVAALIGAIEDANGTDGPTVITLAPGGQYPLSSIHNNTRGANGLPVVTGHVVVEGNGATISRNADAPAFRLFNVALGGELHLTGLTLQGGRVESTSSPNNFGGAVYTRGILTLTGSHVTASHASNSGGGIYNAGNNDPASGVVTLTDSTVTDNTASLGGGIYNANIGWLTVTSSVVSGNETTISGGGIYNSAAPSGRLTLTDSTITGNSAALGGGGLRSAGTGSTVTLHSSTVSDNDGGGISNSASGRLTVVATSVTGNRSPSAGAGISNAGGVLTVVDSTIADNTGVGDGGGISNTTGWLELSNSTIAGNRTDGDGGGISNISGSVGIEATTIAHNHAANAGGGIATGAEPTLIAALVAANSATTDDDVTGTLGPGSAHNLVGGDPGLDPDGLQDNGGPTHTIALTRGSAVIDAVPLADCPVEVDQRGITRPQGDGCDIGAFEAASMTIADGDVAGLIAAIEQANATGGHIELAPDGDYVLAAPYTAQPRAVGLPPITGEITIDAADATIRRSDAADMAIFSVFYVAAGGSLSLDRATISGGDSGFTNRGGGIWNDRGVLVLTRSTVTGNVGGINGTGLLSERPTVTVTDSSISDNDGRGIFGTHARLTVTDSTIADNTGGGIFHGESGTVTLTRTAIRGNRDARGGGGGVRVGGATASITDSLIEDNHAEVGGGIYVYRNADVRLTGTTVRGNTALTDPSVTFLAGVGGGIYNRERLTVTDSTVTGNTATRRGGGIYNTYTAQVGLPTASLIGTTVADNRADDGAGVYNTSGRVDLSGGAITGNVATGAGGGINNLAILTIDGTAIRHNEAASGAAAANGYLPRDPAASLTITGALLADNVATGNGGAISNSTGSLELTDSTLRDNQATTGGAISAYSGSLRVSGTTVNGNTAAEDGGGIWNASSNLTVTNTTVAGNSASGDGGGITSTNGPLTLRSSTVSDNTAAQGGGLSSPGWLTMDSALVAGNTAELAADIDADVNNDRGYNLVGDGSGSQFFAEDQGNQIGTTAAPVDPLLAPLADHGGPTETMALLAGSPAIDIVAEGTNGCGDTLATDQRGVTRPQGGACDVGAFEADDVTATTPGAPTGVSATPGDGHVTVDWSAPASDGGRAITGYTVTADPGGASATVDADTSTAVVTGLSNATSYTVTVTATNAVGTGPASEPSVPVTPYEPVELESYTSTMLDAGDEVVVSPQGQGPTADDPVQLTVMSPNAGTVVTGWQEPQGLPADGYTFAGMEFHVRAPDGSVDAPLELTFEIHLSAFDDVVDATDLAVFRNGSEVADCTDLSKAEPDPCVAQRTIDGELALVRVLTSQASVWQAGVGTSPVLDDDQAPIVRNVAATPNPVAAGTPLTLSATADDRTTGDSAIASAAYRWRAVGGSDWSTWSDLHLDAGDHPALAIVSAALADGLPSAGLFTVCVRATDEAGNTSDGQDCTEVAVAAAGGAAGLGTVASALRPAGGTASFAFAAGEPDAADAPGAGFFLHLGDGDRHFVGTELRSVVLTGEPRVRLRGSGVLDGDVPCSFTLEGWDGSLRMAGDGFALRIHGCEGRGGNVYQLDARALLSGAVLIVDP